MDDSQAANLIAVTINGLNLSGAGNTDGAILSVENLTLDELTVSGACRKYGPILAYDANPNDAVWPYLTVRNTTFSGNLCAAQDASSGAIYSDFTRILIENSTFSGNSGCRRRRSECLEWLPDGLHFYLQREYDQLVWRGHSGQLQLRSRNLPAPPLCNNTIGLAGGGVYSYFADGPFTLLNTLVTGKRAGYAGVGVTAYKFFSNLNGPILTHQPASHWLERLNEQPQPRLAATEPICQSAVTSPMNSLANSRLIAISNAEISSNHVTQSPMPDNPGSGGGIYLEEVQAQIQDTKARRQQRHRLRRRNAACASPLALSTSTIFWL